MVFYLNYIAKKAKNLEKIRPVINEIIVQQNLILATEQWDKSTMNYDLKLNMRANTAEINFNVALPKSILEIKPLTEITQKSEPERTVTVEYSKNKNDDYDFGGP